jgi:diguanylate cyclase (GGDEF)-like protein
MDGHGGLLATQVTTTGASAVELAAAGDRQVKGSLAKVVLSYVRRLFGEEGVATVLAEAEHHRPRGGLDGAASWTSSDYILAIADAAAGICGEAEIGRRSGEELMRMQQERGTVDFVVATGSVEAALALAANGATKMSNGRRYVVEETGPFRARIVGRYADSSVRHPFFCGQAAGYFGGIPGAFGFSGVLAEVRCQCRGDERCVYEIRWSEIADRSLADQDRVGHSRDRADSFVERFEQLHLMATDLASAEEVDTVLARVADRAGLAIDAPRYLLAVKATDDDPVRIFHKGFDPVRAERFAARLLAGGIVEGDGCVVAPVASATRLYGRFVATYPAGSVVTEMEKRLLSAYARHAAAALEAVASLESARRDRDTATALLGLANALAEVGTRDDVAARLAQAVPDVAGCDLSGVWLWDGRNEHLELVAHDARRPAPRDSLPPSLRVEDLPGLADVIARPTPFLLHRDGAEPGVAHVMQRMGVLAAAVVPITARGAFLGLVIAGFDGDLRVDDAAAREVLGKLRGLAGQAATALDNAALVTRMKDQAMHDALTGLPNRTLLEDRAHVALSQRHRAGDRLSLLFIDLDRFKVVNDSLGHAVGDDVIREAAQRLQSCLRAGDTLARLGGDEFVALLPRIGSQDDAEHVAMRMIDVLNAPLLLGGRSISISCSIGISSAPDHGSDYVTLLRHADHAMYAAKQLRRGTYSVHAC